MGKGSKGEVSSRGGDIVGGLCVVEDVDEGRVCNRNSQSGDPLVIEPKRLMCNFLLT